MKLSVEQIEQIHYLYVEKELSQIEVAKRMNLCRNTIAMQMRAKGLLRPFIKATAIVTAEAIRRCGDKRFSIKTFANEIGVSPSIIAKRMREEGVSLGKGAYFKISEEQEESICNLYPNKTQKQIAELFGVSKKAVQLALKRNGVKSVFRTGKRSIFVDRLGRQFLMASSYEKAFAKILDGKKLDWDYENRRFKLGDGSIYTPDFWVPLYGQFFELKGYMRPEAATKIALFRKEYPLEKLVVLKRNHLENLYGMKFDYSGSAVY